jgi:hypothetical protein
MRQDCRCLNRYTGAVAAIGTQVTQVPRTLQFHGEGKLRWGIRPSIAGHRRPEMQCTCALHRVVDCARGNSRTPQVVLQLHAILTCICYHVRGNALFVHAAGVRAGRWVLSIQGQRTSPEPTAAMRDQAKESRAAAMCSWSGPTTAGISALLAGSYKVSNENCRKVNA